VLKVFLDDVGVVLVFVFWFLHLVYVVRVVLLRVGLNGRVPVASCRVLIFFLP